MHGATMKKKKSVVRLAYYRWKSENDCNQISWILHWPQQKPLKI